MTNSIFLTVKKMLGIDQDYHAFDIDIITDINSVFLTLNQIGVGPTGFQISGEDEVWADFVDPEKIPGIQTYLYQKVRLLFDPPTSSFVLNAIQSQIDEFEWRFNVQAEYLNKEEGE